MRLEKRRAHTVALVAALAAAGLVACADAPGASGIAGPDSRSPTARPSGTGVAPGDAISVYDDLDGTTYRLSVSERRLSVRSAGGTAVVALTAEQAGAYAGVMRDMQEGAPVAAGLLAATQGGPGDGGGGGCDRSAPFCVSEPLAATPVDDAGLHAEATGLLASGRVLVRFGPPPARTSALGAFTQGSADVCSDVFAAGVPRVLELKQNRKNLLRALASGLGGEALSAVLGKLIAGTAGAAAIAGDIVGDYYIARVAVSVLAYQWNTYNCGTRRTPYGPIYFPGAGRHGSMYACTEKLVAVSFDGGSSWSWISATVCMVEHVM